MEEKRTDVFVSYSHKDKKWLTRLQTHLRPLIREGNLNLWDDTKIQSGAEWRNEIQQAINKAKVAVLLISADFLASDFIHNNELPPLLEKAKDEGVLIFSVIISPCRFIETRKLSKFQSINDPSQPLSSMSKTAQENIFLKLSKDIEQYISREIPNEVKSEISNLQKEAIENSEKNPASSAEKKSQELNHISVPLLATLENIKQSVWRTSAFPGITTGFRDLDSVTAGLQAPDVILVAAKPHIGISAFGLSVALNAAISENRTVVVFSMNSTKEKISNQMMCMEARVDLHRFNAGFLTKDEWARLAEAMGVIVKSPILINDSNTISVQDVRSALKEFVGQQTLDLVIIDNLQHLTVTQSLASSDHQNISQISCEIKAIAREFNVPVLVLCPLPSVDMARPSLLSLGKMGLIEQFTDFTVLMHKEEPRRRFDGTEDEEIKHKVELTVIKNDNGATWNINLAFLKEFYKFENLWQS